MFEELGNVIFQNFQISFGQIIMERSFSTIVTPIQSHWNSPLSSCNVSTLSFIVDLSWRIGDG